MKCNPDKINNFYKGGKFEQDIKDFVSYLFTVSDADESIRFAFLDLGFYEIENEEDVEEDSKVIDFYKLSNFDPKLRKVIFKITKKAVSDEVSDFFDSFITEDLQIVIPYKKWKKINRKNKLTELNQ